MATTAIYPLDSIPCLCLSLFQLPLLGMAGSGGDGLVAELVGVGLVVAVVAVALVGVALVGIVLGVDVQVGMPFVVVGIGVGEGRGMLVGRVGVCRTVLCGL